MNAVAGKDLTARSPVGRSGGALAEGVRASQRGAHDGGHRTCLSRSATSLRSFRYPVKSNLPTHVRPPSGDELPVFSRELATEIARRHGSPVEMMHLDRGIFDEASISVITAATVDEIGTLAAQPPNVRRFRPNILIASLRPAPFGEDEWVGGVLSFGATGTAAAIGITTRDQRCSMVNLDPDSARPSAEVLRAIVRANDSHAGVYGTVMRRGRLAVGQPVFLDATT